VGLVDSDNKDPQVAIFKLGDGGERSWEHVCDVVSVD
jgi:hypothetical protein